MQDTTRTRSCCPGRGTVPTQTPGVGRAEGGGGGGGGGQSAKETVPALPLAHPARTRAPRLGPGTGWAADIRPAAAGTPLVTGRQEGIGQLGGTTARARGDRRWAGNPTGRKETRQVHQGGTRLERRQGTHRQGMKPGIPWVGTLMAGTLVVDTLAVGSPEGLQTVGAES